MGVIRLLLALSVVLNHSYYFFGFNLLGGALAVQAFFIISGFYMSLILNEKYIKQNNSYNLFITNRFMRIFPIYACVLFVAVLFFTLSYLYPASQVNPAIGFGNPIALYKEHYAQFNIFSLLFLLFTNLFIFLQDVVMFLGMDASGNFFFTSNFRNTDPQMFTFLIIPQAWTVALELTFYLIAPFLLRRSGKIILGIIAATFAIRFLTYFAGYDNDPWTYRFFPFEVGYFLMGNISYLIYKKIRAAAIDSKYCWGAFVFILGLTIIYPVIKFTGSPYLYCLSFAVCLPFTFYLTKSWKYDTYLGDLSYPVYLVHVLVLSVVGYFSAYMNKLSMGAVYIISVLAFSVLLNELISKKVEKIRQRRVAASKQQESGFLKLQQS